MAVYYSLKKHDLEGARQAVSRIVGRDTQALDETGVAKAAVETVAENTCDGVTAPLIFLFLGGLPAGMAYKAVSTLDSMVGYKNEKYRWFGWASARLDDVLNFIPARLSGLLMCLGQFYCPAALAYGPGASFGGTGASMPPPIPLTPRPPAREPLKCNWRGTPAILAR